MKKGIVLALALCFNLTPLPILAETTGEATTGPDIVIRESKDKTIHEYRVNGFLYAYKIVPKNGGMPYYLIRADDDGQFVRADDPDFVIPSWKILEW
jgi:hypothetical protein